MDLAGVLAFLVFLLGLVSAIFWVRRMTREESRKSSGTDLFGEDPLGIEGGIELPSGDSEGEKNRALEALIPDSRFIEIDGRKLHYVQAGEGPDVVLLHGIGASLFIWRYLFPLLQANHRVTAFDLLGFGKSDKHAEHDYGLDGQTEAVSRALKALGIGKAFVVGSSMGGAITLWLAKREPERFGRVAALAPATDSTLVPAPALAKNMTAAVPVIRHAVNRHTMKLILSRVVSRRDLITDDVVDSYLEPFLDKGDALRAFWSATALLSDKRLPSELRDVKTPVLVIYGEKDMMVPRRSIDKLMQLLPNASLISHGEGGHHIMEDEPEWIARVLENFFRAT